MVRWVSGGRGILVRQPLKGGCDGARRGNSWDEPSPSPSSCAGTVRKPTSRPSTGNA